MQSVVTADVSGVILEVKDLRIPSLPLEVHVGVAYQRHGKKEVRQRNVAIRGNCTLSCFNIEKEGFLPCVVFFL